MEAYESKARAGENMYNIVERALSNLVAALFSAYTILTQFDARRAPRSPFTDLCFAGPAP